MAAWAQVGGGAEWPAYNQWAELDARNRLEELEPPRLVEARGGNVELSFEMPMPSISLLELIPA